MYAFTYTIDNSTLLRTIMKLWLDDIFPPTVSSIQPDAKDWLWVKNYDAFVKAIEAHEGEIELISYDNDLGEEKEGKHCFNMMESILHDGYLANLKRVILHSDNSSAVNSLLTAKDSLDRYFNISLERHRRITSSMAAVKSTDGNKSKNTKTPF